MLAVEAPVRKLAVIAGATLAIAAFVHRPHAAERVVAQQHHRLTLHAPSLSNAYYLTVFARHHLQRTTCDLQSIDVTGDDKTIDFSTKIHMYDGCLWEGVEHLSKIDDHTYSYSYDENILACEPDAVPALKTPRTGIVTVDD
jgi:hypothetical protein